jgi:hypothetical protein
LKGAPFPGKSWIPGSRSNFLAALNRSWDHPPLRGEKKSSFEDLQLSCKKLILISKELVMKNDQLIN